MAGRIVLFGATGYTGELVARELAGIGERPVLAARNEARVRALASDLGGLEAAVADVRRPESVAALVGRGDVLVSCVGPFARWGGPAGRAGGGARGRPPGSPRGAAVPPGAVGGGRARAAGAGRG